MTAGVFVVVAFILVMNNSSRSYHLHTQPTDGDIVHQTFNNFDSFRDGKMVPDVRSDNPRAVQAFFTKNASFAASVPRICSYNFGSLSNRFVTDFNRVSTGANSRAISP